MASNENLTEVLNDLIKINNDRIVGYEKAADEAKDIDIDLRAIFHRMGEESKQYVTELTQEVMRLGGDATSSTTNSGKIYRAWMDIKAAFTGSDRETLLNNCEFGEDAAQKAYDAALSADVDLPVDLRQMIMQQKTSLKSSHDVIKRYRDLHRSVKHA